VDETVRGENGVCADGPLVLQGDTGYEKNILYDADGGQFFLRKKLYNYQ
jgi:hypothetical protein